MAPSFLQGALINGACSLQSALALGACSLQGALTSPCARGHFIRHTGLRVPSQSKANFLMSVAFPKKRCFLPHLAHVSHLSQPQAGFARGPAQQDRRRALRVLFGTDDTRCVTRSVRRTKPHTNTQPTAHSQRPARHLHRDPSISYYQRSASAHIATAPNATKPRRTAVRAARSRLLKAQLDTTCTSSKRAPGRSATAAISVTAESTLDPWDQTGDQTDLQRSRLQ